MKPDKSSYALRMITTAFGQHQISSPMKPLIFIIIYMGLSLSLFAQSVGIHATAAAPDPSAILDVQASNKGMLIPRMTTTERLGITSAATGLLVYDTSTGSFWYRNARGWIEMASFELPLDGTLTLGPPVLDANYDARCCAPSNYSPSWQSFTVEKTGRLRSFEVFAANTTVSDKSFTIRLFKGEGIAGDKLYEGTKVTPAYNFGLDATTWSTVTLSDPLFVKLGEVYTIELVMPQGVYWRSDIGNPYPGGNSSAPAFFGEDFAFRTYVEEAASVYQADTLRNTFSFADGTIYVAPSAYVGIGNRTPTRPLHLVANTTGGIGTMMIQNSHPDGFAGTYYRDRDGSQSGFIGWINTGAPSFGTGAGTLQIGTGTSAPLLLNPGNLGNVGIGTNTPTKGRLEISGGPLGSLSNYGYLNNNRSRPAGWFASSGSHTYSIYASGRIACSEFNAFSDARIKHIQGISDAAADLHTLMQIEITDYQLRDSIGKGTDSYKKVIAQQVAEVYPQAVKRDLTEVVPDIYSQAAIQEGWIMLETDLIIGERVKLITEKSSEVYTVSAVEAHRFQVSDLTSDSSLLTPIFVYGREVDDFHTVDYEALSMLNVSATQEQQKIIEVQKLEIKNLEARLAQAKEKMQLFKRRFQLLETELNQAMIKAAIDSRENQISLPK